MIDAAPKRIWVWKNSPNGEFVVSDDDQPYPTGSPQYILASEVAALIREAEARVMERAAEICEGIRTRIANGPMPEGARFDYEQSIRAEAAAIRQGETT